MHISSQLATAVTSQAPRNASSSSDHAPGFHETLQAAASNGKAASEGKSAGGTTAASDGSSAGPIRSGVSGKTPLTVEKDVPGQASAAGNLDLSPTLASASDGSEMAESSIPALNAQVPAGQFASKKGKAASSSADRSSDPAPVVLAASAGAEPSALPVASPIPLSPASATQETPASAARASPLPGEQDQAIATPNFPATNVPVADQGIASRAADGAPGEAPDARSTPTADDGPISNANTASAAESVPSLGKPSFSSATNGAAATSPMFAIGAGGQVGTLPSVSASTGGKDRFGAGEVRGKRKDTPASGSAPERASANTPAPFGTKLAEAQAPAQAGANDARSADPVVLQKALDGSQALPPTTLPTSAQPEAAPTTPAPAASAAPSAPATPADVPAEAVLIPGASSAQLIQSAGPSEMRLGMHSAEFGNISISTSLNHQAISAQISLDHSELGRALAVHLPAIEEKLGTAYGLHARVEVRDESAASRPATDSGQQGGASHEQSGEARGRQGRSGSAVSMLNEVTAGNVGSNLAASSPSSAIPAERHRLDIRI